jgi:RNA polymerase sigma factor (sigma-70 family)
MPTAQLEPVIHYLRRAAPEAADDLPDARLLTRFVVRGDEAAFATLVHRHGPLVLGVCRRVLRDRHAADDAFQATFLLLARKAGSLARPELLANWLHGVACRTAARARAEAVRRRARESKAPVPQASMPDEDLIWRDLGAVLDEEVNRLPGRQREAVLLCYLEGRTNAEAATLLGCPRGTVATLLARARLRLRRRLLSRGVAPAALAGVCLTEPAWAASVPATVTRATAQAASLYLGEAFQAAGPGWERAVFLAKGVARAMLMRKLKVAAAVVLLLVGLAGAGAGLTTRCISAEQPTSAAESPPPPRPEEAEKAAQSPPAPPAEETATCHTANFAVTAPTRQAARKVARAAEQHRKALALLWLGKEMPTWSERCPVRVRLTDHGPACYTSFQFEGGKVRRQSMDLQGKLDMILADLVPHEVTHTILAHWAGRALPRWADEGAALLAESAASRARHAQAALTVLDEDRALPLRRLLPLAEYPNDVMAMYAQGYSLVDFLVKKDGRAKLLAFVDEGSRYGWARAARERYGYRSLDEMERAWVAYARKTPREAAKPNRVVAGPAGWSISRQGVRQLRGRLPEGPAPVQCLVALGKDGRLTIGRKVNAYKATTHAAMPGRQAVTTYTAVLVPLETVHTLKEVKVYDTHGKRVDHKTLAEQLRGETPALVSEDGKPVDPLHLRLVKEGTLVFVLPVSTAVPPPPDGAVLPAPPVTTQAAASVKTDHRVQRAARRYLDKEGHGKRGPCFFELAMLLNPLAQRWAPIAEKDVLEFLGEPDLVSEQGTQNADDFWAVRTTRYIYVVDNRQGRTIPRDAPMASGERIAVSVTIHEGVLDAVGWNTGPLKEGPGCRRYKKK